jgi:hypothetical protein
MDTCVKCLTGLNIPVTGNGMLKKKLDEQEAAYDEWNEFDDEPETDDCVCLDYSQIKDDEDEEG